MIVNNFTATGRTIPMFKAQIMIENDDNETIKILGYSIKIHLSGLQIGEIFKFEDIYLDPKGNHYFNEEFKITPYIFNSIEKERKFSDVTVDIRVNCLCVKRLQSTDELNVGNLGVEHISIQPTKLSQNDWAKLVSDMGYNNYQIFEIPYSEVSSISEFEKIMKRLTEAQDHYNQGRNEEVVTSCRKAFELLVPIVTTKNSNKFEMNSELSNKIDVVCTENCHNKKSTLIEEIRQKIWPILHIGPHEGYNVTREDAEYVLTLSLSTIRYYIKQLNKLSEN